MVNTFLSTDLGGLLMKNPITVASGTFGSGREFAQLWDEIPLNTLGAVTTKGVSSEPWPGNSGIRISESASGMLNSIGLQNPGIETFCLDDLPWLARQDVPVIVNVSGHRTEEYVRVITRLEQEAACSAYEINISCPNVDCGGMSFGTDPVAAAEVTAACRKASSKPLLVKLTPNVTDIVEIAQAVEASGADALSMINTVAGMAIDSAHKSTVFQRGVAGLSGPAIKPVALYAIYRVYEAVRLPILGMGGISTLDDALEFILAGATALAVGTANFKDPYTAPRLVYELEEWCSDEGVSHYRDLIGAAHP